MIDESIEMRKNQEEKNTGISSDVLRLMKDITPKINRDEIFFNDSKDAQAAEAWIYKFGQIISNFENKDELNLVMQIMSAIAYAQVIKSGGAFESDIASYFQLLGRNVEYTTIQNILEKISTDKFGPLIIRAPYISFSRLGRLLYTSYKKIKSDLLAQEKEGEFGDLYWALEDAKTFLLYNEMGIDLDTIFSLSYNLRCAILQVQNSAEILLHKNKVIEHLDKLREIIVNIRTSDVWNNGTTGNAIKLNEHNQISSIILDAIKAAYDLLSMNISYQTTRSGSIIQNPVKKIPDFIIEKWDSIDWMSKIASHSDTFYPMKYQLILNKHSVLTAIYKFFEPKFVSPDEILPEVDETMEEIEDGDTIFQNSTSTMEEVQNIIINELLNQHPDYDHQITLVKDRLESIRRINCLLSLNGQHEITIDNPVNIDNPIENVVLYTSHQICEISPKIMDEVKEDKSL